MSYQREKNISSKDEELKQLHHAMVYIGDISNR
jgi:hypothetical protein